MTSQNLYLDGVGLFGPGLTGWEQACEVLAGRQPYVAAPTALPAVEKLPPAERRRVGIPVKLSLAIGLAAARHAGADLASLATVFSSTEADCANTHAILEALASNDRALSPTRFHNSVHNAPSGYWSIATGCGDAPITGRRVVHRIVKAGWRQGTIIGGQGFQDGVGICTVGFRRGKHGGQAGKISPRMAGGRQSDG